ncbi:GFA family protein [Aliikangiella sp. IMCC44359]|uniref:GFA family protein n=1 Tax=Aliikangiella sp. IMCC44359 TaxID=3459125 RepID=UPI00403AF990
MTIEQKQFYQGQCLCGAIQYRVTHINQQMGHCHCSMCRKFHGAAFATFGVAAKKNFEWLKGEDQLKSYIASNGSKRQFCQHCGSSMTFEEKNSDGNVVEFTLGTLDSEIEERPDAHIYVDYKANWFSISDELPQFLEGREKE